MVLTPVPTGSDIQVNTYTTNDQRYSSVTALGDGGFVVTWTSYGQDGSGWGIYGQRYAANGSAVGGEFQVNTYTTNDQRYSSVTALGDGGFVVTWSSIGQDGSSFGIYGQRYAANGSAVGGEFQVNTYTTDVQNYSSVTALGDGGFVVTWNSRGQDGNGFGIYGQRYAANGSAVGGEFQVNTNTTGEQVYSSVTALSDGGFVVTWSSIGQDGSGIGIYGQRYAANGNAVGGEFQVNTYTTGDQNYSSVTALGDGGFVVTWSSIGQDGSSFGIYGQRYAANGSAVGGEFQVNTYTTDLQDYSSVTALGDGGFVVTWNSGGQDGSGSGIYGQRYAANGSAVGGEFQVNQITAGQQLADTQWGSNTLSTLTDGRLVATWVGLGAEEVFVRLIEVPESNTAPVVAADTNSATDDGAAATGNVLTDDYDPDPTDTISVANSGVHSGSYGTLTLNADGNYSYQVTDESIASGFADTDVFAIDVTDGTAVSSTTLTINVTGSNDAPVGAATAVLAAGTEDQAYTLAAADLLAGFTDADGDPLSVANLAAATGTLTDNGNGTYTLTLPANFNGPVGLTYEVVDGNGGSIAATQSFTVDAANDAPGGAATAVLAAGIEDQAYTLAAADLLAGFTDADGDALSVANLVAATGTVTDNGNGNYTVALPANFNGPVGLTYDVVDGNGGSVVATQSFIMAPANDGPTITSNGGGETASVAALENTTLVTALAATDPDSGQTLTYSVVPAGSGTGEDAALFEIRNGNELHFVAPPNFEFLPDQGPSGLNVTVEVSDGNGGTDRQTLTVTVTDVDELSVTKTVTGITDRDGGDGGITVDEAGDVINYQFTLTNPGNVALTNISLHDRQLDLLSSFTGDTDNDNQLDVGETWTYTGSRTVTQAELDHNGTFENRFTSDTIFEPIVADPSETFAVALGMDSHGRLTNVVADMVTKVAVSLNAAQTLIPQLFVLGSASLTFRTNDPHATDAVHLTDTEVQALVDWGIGGYIGPSPVDVLHSLGTLNNSVTVFSSETNPVAATASVPLTQDPQLAIAKDVTGITDANGGDGGAVVDEAGDVINYQITLTNPGNVSLTGVTVADPQLDAAAVLASGDTDHDGVLDVGETWTYTGSHTVTQAELDSAGTFDNRYTEETIFEARVVDSTGTLNLGLGIDSQGRLTNVHSDIIKTIAVSQNASQTIVPQLFALLATQATVRAHDPAEPQVVHLTDTEVQALVDWAQSGYVGPSPIDVLNTGLANTAVADSTETGPVSATVTVPLNRAPVITSDGGGAAATRSVVENTTAVAIVAATDPDLVETLTYAIAGGADAGKFSLNASTGALAFLAAPNYEVPTDANANNVYEVTVQVSDGHGGIDTQVLSVAVTDVQETAPPIIGTDGNNTLNGTAGDDVIDAQGGNDCVNAGNGNDRITGGSGSDYIDAGAGNDVIVATVGDGSDIYRGGSGIDTVDYSAISAPLTINLNGLARSSQTGLDLLDSIENAIGGSGRDTITGNGGANALAGGEGNDTLRGGGGNDTLDGGSGNDALSGDAGNDWLNGGTGSDVMRGGSGDDTYVVDASGDSVIESSGGGTDTVETALASYTLGTNVENLTFTGSGSHQGTGNNLANVITGSEGNDTLSGNNGNDTLRGANGNDTLSGGAGNDRLEGGAGNDALNGGTGNDTFVFATGFGNDAITGFGDVSGNNDVIEFSTSVFATFAAVQTAMAQVGADVVITADATDHLTIQNVTVASLDAGDFRFVA